MRVRTLAVSSLALCTFLVLRAWPETGASPNGPDGSCAVRVRPAGSDEALLHDRNPLFGAPENLNDAPGPGSLRAVVRTDSLLHPFIHIVDTATGASRRLCSGSQPRFSPDGRWIACNRWKSRARPYTLAIVEVKSGRVRTLDRVGHVADFAWSPDSKRVAFASMPYDSSFRIDIGWIGAQGNRPHVVASDTLLGVEYGGCEWAPDSRRFVARRARELEHDPTSDACDLWLFDVEGRACRLTHTPEREEEGAGWIDDRRIGFVDGTEHKREGAPRFVIELGAARSGP